MALKAFNSYRLLCKALLAPSFVRYWIGICSQGFNIFLFICIPILSSNKIFVLFQNERFRLFESFLFCVDAKECFQRLSSSKFARLTEGFSPRDLKRTAAEMEMKFLASPPSDDYSSEPSYSGEHTRNFWPRAFKKLTCILFGAVSSMSKALASAAYCVWARART